MELRGKERENRWEVVGKKGNHNQRKKKGYLIIISQCLLLAVVNQFDEDLSVTQRMLCPHDVYVIFIVVLPF